MGSISVPVFMVYRLARQLYMLVNDIKIPQQKTGTEKKTLLGKVIGREMVGVLDSTPIT